MVKDGKRTTEEVPESGASCVAGLSPAHAELLEQAGELIIDGRLYTKEAARDTNGEQDA